MSRIGRKPITVPSGVEVTIADSLVTVKGPKGTLTERCPEGMIIENKDGIVTVNRPSENKKDKAYHGLTRTLIANMVQGVTEGWKKELEINGIGYRAEKQGKKLKLLVGKSHPVELEETADITIEVADNKITVSGTNKQMVGQFAAEIRNQRPVEPYKGKGIRYVGEYVKKKEGKSGKK